MEGRRSKRVKAARQVTVSFAAAEVHFTGELIDISATGVLVRSPRDLELATAGKLEIDMGADTFRAAAVVRRYVADIGVAFQFTEMSAHDRELLHRLLLRLGQAAG
jgi:c-di-GMP-binding flagellar brake protein YcgR